MHTNIEVLSRKRCKQNHHLRDTCLFFLRRKVGLCIFLRFFANLCCNKYIQDTFFKDLLEKDTQQNNYLWNL